MNHATPALEQHLGYWLRYVSNHVSGAFRERLVKEGVTVAEWVALRSLHDQAPCTLGDLAGRMGLDGGVTSRLVERLVRKKLVSRKANAVDRRFVTLALTPKAQRLMPKLAREADRNDEYFFAPLGKTDKDHLRRILTELVRAHRLTQKPIE